MKSIFVKIICCVFIFFLYCGDKDEKTDLKEYNEYISGCSELIEGINNLTVGDIVYFEDTLSAGIANYWDYSISDETVIVYIDKDNFCLEYCDENIAGGPYHLVIKFQAMASGTSNIIFTFSDGTGQIDSNDEIRNYSIVVESN